MRLRQVALVAKDLDGCRREIFDLLGLQEDYIDPGVAEFGLRNSVMCIGDTFLEIVSPTKDNTTAGRLLERRGGDGGYMVLVQVPDLTFFSERTEALEMRKVWQVELKDTKAFHLHPKDMGGAIVSIDEMQPASSWRWGGPDWQSRAAENALTIKAVDIQASEPEELAQRWANVFNEQCHQASSTWVISLDYSQINFVKATDGRGDGVSAIEFLVADILSIKSKAESMGLEWKDNSVRIAGLDFRFCVPE